MQDAKRRWRERLLSARAGWDPAVRARASLRISEAAASLPEMLSAGTVLGFWSMPERFEVDVRPLLVRLALRGVTVGLPVVSRDRDDRILRFRRFDGEDRLVAGPFGTRHPDESCPFLEPADGDVLLVPALGVDSTGIRLGWGAGYYDRRLAAHPAFTICPIFDGCLVDSLPTETHDRPVTLIVTERRIVRVGTTA